MLKVNKYTLYCRLVLHGWLTGCVIDYLFMWTDSPLSCLLFILTFWLFSWRWLFFLCTFFHVLSLINVQVSLSIADFSDELHDIIATYTLLHNRLLVLNLMSKIVSICAQFYEPLWIFDFCAIYLFINIFHICFIHMFGYLEFLDRLH